MSSAATITFEPDTIGVPAKEWQSFCQEHGIVHSPQTIGGNVYYAGEVEVHYTRHDLHFSTFWMGSAIPDVARLAMLAWRRWGGQLTADPEIRKTIVRLDPEGKTTGAAPTATDMPVASMNTPEEVGGDWSHAEHGHTGIATTGKDRVP